MPRGPSIFFRIVALLLIVLTTSAPAFAGGVMGQTRVGGNRVQFDRKGSPPPGAIRLFGGRLTVGLGRFGKQKLPDGTVTRTTGIRFERKNGNGYSHLNTTTTQTNGTVETTQERGRATSHNGRFSTETTVSQNGQQVAWFKSSMNSHRGRFLGTHETSSQTQERKDFDGAGNVAASQKSVEATDMRKGFFRRNTPKEFTSNGSSQSTENGQLKESTTSTQTTRFSRMHERTTGNSVEAQYDDNGNLAQRTVTTENSDLKKGFFRQRPKSLNGLTESTTTDANGNVIGTSQSSTEKRFTRLHERSETTSLAKQFDENGNLTATTFGTDKSDLRKGFFRQRPKSSTSTEESTTVDANGNKIAEDKTTSNTRFGRLHERSNSTESQREWDDKGNLSSDLLTASTSDLRKGLFRGTPKKETSTSDTTYKTADGESGTVHTEEKTRYRGKGTRFKSEEVTSEEHTLADGSTATREKTVNTQARKLDKVNPRYDIRSQEKVTVNNAADGSKTEESTMGRYFDRRFRSAITEGLKTVTQSDKAGNVTAQSTERVAGPRPQARQ